MRFCTDRIQSKKLQKSKRLMNSERKEYKDALEINMTYL